MPSAEAGVDCTPSGQKGAQDFTSFGILMRILLIVLLIVGATVATICAVPRECESVRADARLQPVPYGLLFRLPCRWFSGAALPSEQSIHGPEEKFLSVDDLKALGARSSRVNARKLHALSIPRRTALVCALWSGGKKLFTVEELAK